MIVTAVFVSGAILEETTRLVKRNLSDMSLHNCPGMNEQCRNPIRVPAKLKSKVNVGAEPSRPTPLPGDFHCPKPWSNTRWSKRHTMKNPTIK